MCGFVSIGSTQLSYRKDFLVFPLKTAFIDAPIAMAGDGKAASLASLDLEGKAAVVQMGPTDQPLAPNVSLRPTRYAICCNVRSSPSSVKFDNTKAV